MKIKSWYRISLYENFPFGITSLNALQPPYEKINIIALINKDNQPYVSDFTQSDKQI